ncbi:MAG: tetraacyldisaccharide 4'-kinase [Alphaproteobacteria bacterium]|nr:tetraacyldisaccharide 4'-kinase [Alphaproteobacteria bacterium]
MRAPEFWRTPSISSALLAPISVLYSLAGAIRRQTTTPWRAPVPVICIGNLVAGGAGKTPVAMAIATIFQEFGKNVRFLSRGYGGTLPGPIRVDPDTHQARHVGDEPLLLAKIAPTWVSRERVFGAEAAIEDGAEVIVMDDGFQNPALEKTLSLVVVDGGYGFGNGRVIPAGPLREGLSRGLKRADAIILLGDDTAGAVECIQKHSPKTPIIRARLSAVSSAQRFVGEKILAFAGIGRPEKFFQTAREIGAAVIAERAFADHYNYTPDDLAVLAEEAAGMDAILLTTAKDFQRIPEDARSLVEVLDVVVEWREPDAVAALLSNAIKSS